MSFGPADFAGFGGLNLAADAEDARGATSILNIDPSDMTLLRPRGGYVLQGTENLSQSNSAIKKDLAFVIGAPGALRLMANDGSVTASKTNYTSSSYPWSLVAHGTTSDTTVYGGDGVQLALYTTAGGFTAPTVSTQAAGATSYTSGRAAPKPLALGVQPKDNRLAAGGYTDATYGPNGTASSYSHVYFSQPEDPTRWDETDYVILGAGDGEQIRAMVVFKDQLFVFKQTKFFVFYGNSTDSTGGTVFNYRTVENAFPGNYSGILPGRVCVAPDGVYILTSLGVYRTTGGPPQLVTPQLVSAFEAPTLAPAGDGFSGTGGAFFHHGCLHFAATFGSSLDSYYWLVVNPVTGDSSIYLYADQLVVGVPLARAVYAPSGVSTTGRKGLLGISRTYTTDNGTAIASYYTSPYLTYGEPKAEKHVRSSELHGTGTVTLAWGKDLQTHGTAESVAMSSGIGHARTGARGRTLSFKIAASAAGWTLNRVVPLLQAVRTGK